MRAFIYKLRVAFSAGNSIQVDFFVKIIDGLIESGLVYVMKTTLLKRSIPEGFDCRFSEGS